jgi:hypothetical protein
MKAAFIEHFGGPAVLKYGDLPDPVAAAGEMVVDVVAAIPAEIDQLRRAQACLKPASHRGTSVAGEARWVPFPSTSSRWSALFAHGYRQAFRSKRISALAEGDAQAYFHVPTATEATSRLWAPRPTCRNFLQPPALI